MGKKFLAIGALVAASMLVSQGAQAKTLEDILKEKGVITEADYKEVQKSKPAYSYTLGKGFTFTSAMRSSSLTWVAACSTAIRSPTWITVEIQQRIQCPAYQTDRPGLCLQQELYLQVGN
jgi:hypothetical protein